MAWTLQAPQNYVCLIEVENFDGFLVLGFDTCVSIIRALSLSRFFFFTTVFILKCECECECVVRSQRRGKKFVRLCACQIWGSSYAYTDEPFSSFCCEYFFCLILFFAEKIMLFYSMIKMEKGSDDPEAGMIL